MSEPVRPFETPASEAASPRLGHRPAVAVPLRGATTAAGSSLVPPVDLAAGGTGSLPKPRVLAPQPRWCERHGIAMAACEFCADPSLLAEFDLEPGDLLMAGVAVYEVAADGWGLVGPVNSHVDGGLW